MPVLRVTCTKHCRCTQLCITLEYLEAGFYNDRVHHTGPDYQWYAEIVALWIFREDENAHVAFLKDYYHRIGRHTGI